MSTSSQSTISSAPEIAGILRKRLEAKPIKDLAVDVGYDASHIGKFLEGTAALKLGHIEKLMSAADLKVVDRNRTCVRPEEIRYLRALYARVQEHASWLLDEGEV